jgi:hypothetical protein
MKLMSSWLRKQLAGSLVLLLTAPFASAAAPPQTLPSGNQQAPGMNVAQEQPIIVDINAPQSEANTNSGKPADTDSAAPAIPQTSGQQSTQPASDQQQTPPQKPVGTAAAPDEKPVGVAASRPAGAVIAPAKQKRVRIILIRTAIIVGAAVAVGTVVALSKGSPSRPN